MPTAPAAPAPHIPGLLLLHGTHGMRFRCAVFNCLLVIAMSCIAERLLGPALLDLGVPGAPPTARFGTNGGFGLRGNVTGAPLPAAAAERCADWAAQGGLQFALYALLCLLGTRLGVLLPAWICFSQMV